MLVSPSLQRSSRELRGHRQALLCCRKEERETCMLQTGRAPGVTSDGCLVSGHPRSEAAARVAAAQHPCSTAPLQQVSISPAPCRGLLGPCSSGPSTAKGQVPRVSFFTGTEVTLALGTWPRQNSLLFCFFLALPVLDGFHSQRALWYE